MFRADKHRDNVTHVTQTGRRQRTHQRKPGVDARCCALPHRACAGHGLLSRHGLQQKHEPALGGRHVRTITYGITL